MAQETAPGTGVSAPAPQADPPRTGSTRRGILVGAGLLGVAGAVAACGGGDETSGASGSGGGAQAAAGGVLAQTGDIPVGGGKIFKDREVVVTQPAQGEFKAFSTKCTHRGCPVTSVQNGVIRCECHGSTFSIADGSVQSGPADKPLPAKQIIVEGGGIKLA
ncbi:MULTISPECIES: Rieske (2Fe-2S) protein [Thermomonospora]|uniref:Cytochrome bc1 complex Rieske iron-sulfur subunit n=1 Tax=Thermomonospora curvata (strain ATCC 19995 / DSM 43183 / JCM 3096 / KCTC 9072 / NBRC 15933 / NCIMB 10081 / Henssen B9) TaxID=471852 RepID=D1A1S1_THECD|nr:MULTISPECIES: Rieske (2Fe-2S) protein [Thermomonospora]ACY97759.1 Rieske (2Fe-2S) domain protein [Thermomonospora curvata DSM 43183]PKK14057.1 MAG: (2Fe-2S)-binding protein [Thermomonospora sp. CIF 1]